MVIEELISLCLVPGVSGREEKVRERIESMLFSREQAVVDAVGNLILRLPGRESKTADGEVLVMAHMDEIGFYVSNIREDGKLVVKNVGGIIEETLPGSYVQVVLENGDLVDGLFGAVPPHLKADGEMFEKVVDVGACSKAEVEVLGIKILDPIVFKKFPTVLNKKYVSVRALDDRFGCYTLVQVANSVVPRRDTVFAWTVQEEIGLKGAKALASKLRPALAVAIDSFACCSKQNKHIKPGYGPVIRAVDNTSVSDPKIVKFITKLAEENGIPLQVGITGGGNDASVFVDVGVPMVALSVPVVYLHSQVEMIHVDDLVNLIKLLKVFLEKF
ncbi:M42 family metallopeptidase [Fervidobacterium thailandense]|uniref:Endoglucanase n=1 Tax=Fervidobacterium thailandense TaxID=1008305 RepID=A0A1E3G217_9BACT|nr:M42 family metallopeptidase [Fervidobacterium thailandense]ODN30252.1 endoglucanase [Fervidobacterium thailandense]